ncbi:MAG: hypothetical protein JSW20_10915 [Nitrospiraceae bacterium]|nr:MAG: hypothetical protein JSW20_10915 [Nitrospiraceae bacterium]
MKKALLMCTLILICVLFHVSSTQAVENLSGKVVETLNSGGYTYVNIENKGNSTWVAVPQTSISVGQEISFTPGSVMTDFTSKTLNRTFDTIVFSGGIKGESKAAPAGKISDMKPPATALNVKKADGPDSYTIAELYEKRAELDNKNVVISGKVIKFSSQIMGKNWMHLQDGSGDVSKGTNDLVVTLQDTLAVGDMVTIKGTVSKDKDFGSGYKYTVMVEDAIVKK